MAHTNPQSCKPSWQTRDDASSKWCALSFKIQIDSSGRLGVGRAPDPPQHGLSACQVACEEALGPSSGSHATWDPAGWGLLGHWGRQSPNMLSTAHRFIQKPEVKKKKKPYSRSGVDSALNSFGIAGGATEEARGWETGRRQPVGAKKAVPGRKAGPDIIPVANMDTYRKKS